MLEVWLFPVDTCYVQPGRYTAGNIQKTEFFLEPGALHNQKVKFDYMVAGLINYRDENPIFWDDTGWAHEPIERRVRNFIEIVRDSNGHQIGLRFHSPKRGLNPNP